MIRKDLIRFISVSILSIMGIFNWAPLTGQNTKIRSDFSDSAELMGLQGTKSAELSNLTIPPLGPLIDSALTHSPLLREQDALIKMREWQEKSSKDDWGRYIQFYSELRYGTVDILISNGASIGYGNKTNSTYYNFGARFQMSIFDLLDQKQKKGIASAQLDYEKIKREDLQRMITEDVIRLWNRLVSYKEIVIINQDHIAVQSGNIYFAEQQYKSGDIPLVEYSRIKEISTKAEQEYQLAKKEYREAYLLLESLVGVKLTAMNPIR